DSAPPQLVLAHACFLQLVEDVSQRRLADPPHAARRELQTPTLALDVPRLLQHIRDLAELVQRLTSLWTEQLLRQRSVHVVRPEAAALELRLEAIHLLQPLHQAHRLAHAQRVLAEERIPLAQ